MSPARSGTTPIRTSGASSSPAATTSTSAPPRSPTTTTKSESDHAGMVSRRTPRRATLRRTHSAASALRSGCAHSPEGQGVTPMASYAEGDLPVAGVVLHYYRMGTRGQPPVVFLHGFSDGGLT